MSESTITTPSGVPWRDNWLVRHGYGPNDSFGPAENDYYCIHGKFHNCDLHTLHMHDCDHSVLGRFPSANSTDHYDDPWPLVTLDSEFVKNTKSLECSSEDESLEPPVFSEVSEETAKAIKMCDDVYNSETKTSPEHTLRTQKYVARVRQASLQSTNASYEHDVTAHDVTLTRSTRSLPRTRDTRQRNSTGRSRSSSGTFDEIIRNEIETTEASREKDKISKDAGTRKTSGHNNGWKLNALYAVVSGADPAPPSDVRRQLSERRYAFIPRRKSSCKSSKSDNCRVCTLGRAPNTVKPQFENVTLTPDCRKQGQTSEDQCYTGNTRVDSSDNSAMAIQQPGLVRQTNVTEPFKVRDFFASGTVQFGK